MFKPLSFKELMYIDKKVLKRAESIHNKHYSNFFTNKKAEKASSIMMLTAYPLMIETENYYNGELLSTYAVFKSIREFDKSYRVTAYYFENLIFRIMSFWEYLYQFLNLHFYLKLYDFRAKNRIIEYSGYTPEFLDEGIGKRLEFIPKSKEEQKIIRKELQKKLQIINKKNIVRYIEKIYEVDGSLKKLLHLIMNNNVEVLKEIRNEIIHQRPAGANFTINFDETFLNYSVLINNSGWIEFDRYENDIERCMERIGEAIQEVHEIVHLNEFPNRIENAGKEYFVKKVTCLSCNDSFIAPSLLLGDNDKFANVIMCPLCRELGCKVNGVIKTTEIDYNTYLAHYFRAFEGLNEERE
ncbi:hypothetical protein BN2127_JRS3_03405 [Bacillus safensis]|uniref:hypothetical protein n=1 Tax=Bacillus safensis TaxID=561879 RepID=UPI0006A8E2E0|nr:hypothetical protein [Bacillus safensis]CUB23322.1 hypothetical protein BN2127_JRS3_03405 [Bacillus safensis]